MVHPDWQLLAAIVCVLAAVAWLLRQTAMMLWKRRTTGCGGCGSCPQAKPGERADDSFVALEQLQTRPVTREHPGP